MSLVLNLHLQASTPSNHLWSTFLLPAPPHFLNQAPPGAQQLTLPDFSNVPHFGHVIVVDVMVVVLGNVVIGVRVISSRSVNGRRDTYLRVWVHIYMCLWVSASYVFLSCVRSQLCPCLCMHVCSLMAVMSSARSFRSRLIQAACIFWRHD